MFPRAEDIIERGVEIASAVFVAVIVVIQGGEGGGCSPRKQEKFREIKKISWLKFPGIAPCHTQVVS